MVADKSVKISGELKEFLDKKKIIEDETYDKVIKRLLKIGGKK